MQEKEMLFDFWNKVNEAMTDISDAARIIINNRDVAEYLVEHSGYTENEDVLYWTCDYIKRLFKAVFDE